MSQVLQRPKHKGTNFATPKDNKHQHSDEDLRTMFQNNAFVCSHNFAFCSHSVHYLATLYDWLQQMGKLCLIANCLPSSTLTFIH